MRDFKQIQAYFSANWTVCVFLRLSPKLSSWLDFHYYYNYKDIFNEPIVTQNVIQNVILRRSQSSITEQLDIQIFASQGEIASY